MTDREYSNAKGCAGILSVLFIVGVTGVLLIASWLINVFTPESDPTKARPFVDGTYEAGDSQPIRWQGVKRADERGTVVFDGVEVSGPQVFGRAHFTNDTSEVWPVDCPKTFEMGLAGAKSVVLLPLEAFSCSVDGDPSATSAAPGQSVELSATWTNGSAQSDKVNFQWSGCSPSPAFPPCTTANFGLTIPREE